jgi:hypothetical protein
MIKDKKLFYELAFTWGIIMTLIGCIVAGALIIAGYKPKKWGRCWYFEIGSGWGGVELGIFFITNKNPSVHTRNHELGHGFQNCKYGPFMIIISLMSMCRYWYRELRYHRRGLTPPTAYDDIWFEGEATKIGTEFMSTFEKD